MNEPLRTEITSSLPALVRDKKELISRLGIAPDTRVLDVGFTGQAVRDADSAWPHALLKQYSEQVYGIDLDLDETRFPPPRYLKASAEDFDLPIKFDLIFAGDLIEHLSNPGSFLSSCRRNLAPGGRIVLTTPNAFNLFTLIEKITHEEPNVNPDHTLYFNARVLEVLLKKNGFEQFSFSHLYTLGTLCNGGMKRKALAALYATLSQFTLKFTETLVVVVTVP